MPRVEKEIVVGVPLTTVYNQWTQFEQFSEFMEHVIEVRQLDDKRLHWKARVAGREKEWEAVIREQVPDERIIWDHVGGAGNSGIVAFEPVGPDQTRVMLQMSYEPEGLIEELGSVFGAISSSVESDLESFKQFIEERRQPTGAFRGEIENPNAPGGHTAGEPFRDSPRES